MGLKDSGLEKRAKVSSMLLFVRCETRLSGIYYLGHSRDRSGHTHIQTQAHLTTFYVRTVSIVPGTRHIRLSDLTRGSVQTTEYFTLGSPAHNWSSAYRQIVRLFSCLAQFYHRIDYFVMKVSCTSLKARDPKPLCTICP